MIRENYVSVFILKQKVRQMQKLSMSLTGYSVQDKFRVLILVERVSVDHSARRPWSLGCFP